MSLSAKIVEEIVTKTQITIIETIYFQCSTTRILYQRSKSLVNHNREEPFEEEFNLRFNSCCK